MSDETPANNDNANDSLDFAKKKKKKKQVVEEPTQEEAAPEQVIINIMFSFSEKSLLTYCKFALFLLHYASSSHYNIVTAQSTMRCATN